MEFVLDLRYPSSRKKEGQISIYSVNMVVGGLATEGEQTFQPIGPCQC